MCALNTDRGSLGVGAHALALEQETQGIVTLIHIEPEPSDGDLTGALAAAVPEEALYWYKARVIVVSGHPAAEIVELATATGAGLIAMGPARAEISTTHDVMAAAPCPVLIAHSAQPVTRGSLRRVAEEVTA